MWESPTLYLPAAQTSDGFFRMIHVWFSPSWIIRGVASQQDLAAPVTRAIQNIDPGLPVARVSSLE